MRWSASGREEVRIGPYRRPANAALGDPLRAKLATRFAPPGDPLRANPATRFAPPRDPLLVNLATRFAPPGDPLRATQRPASGDPCRYFASRAR